VAITKLKWLRVQVFAGDVVKGQIMINPSCFEKLAGVTISSLQRFEVSGSDRLVIQAPSPLSKLGPIDFLEATSHEDLVLRIEGQWRAFVLGIGEAVKIAQRLASDAKLCFDPWRIEGTMIVNFERIRLLFSPRGDRACVTGIDNHPMINEPAPPRIILPVERGKDPEAHDRLWRSAIEQARKCVAEVNAPHESQSLSLDLATRDLVASYQGD